MRIIITSSLLLLLSACGGGQARNAATPVPAAEMKNPVERNQKSIDNGKRLYDKYCANCHGAAGDAKGEAVAEAVKTYGVQPSDLTDNVWTLGDRKSTRLNSSHT